MFQLFPTYVASVLSGYCICCTGYIFMLLVYVSNVLAVSNLCCKYCIWMLHMLHWLYMYVASVCFKCFNCFKPMLQALYLDVAYVTNVCCKCFICFGRMLQVFHEQARQGGAGKGGLLGCSGPRACGSRHGSIGVAVDAEHEAASIGGQQVRSTRRT
jgi:hypothetical protein